MIPDTLYALAFAFRKSKLWTKLYDTQLFALRHSDGTLGYCCVMGMLGEHLALAEYPGEAGLDSYRRLSKTHSREDPSDDLELSVTQDCSTVSFQSKGELRPWELAEVRAYTDAHGLSLRGKKAFPQFERFRPRRVPWRLEDETDQRHLAEALEAALEVSARLTGASPQALGFTEGAPFARQIPLLEKTGKGFVWRTTPLGEPREPVYISPEVKDDISLAKLAKCKKRGGTWACALFLHPQPVSDELDVTREDAWDALAAPPYFPYVLLIVEPNSGLVLYTQLLPEPEDILPVLRELLELVQQAGKPAQILVSDPRTHAFFRHLAPALGAKLVKKPRIPSLDEARESYEENFCGEGPDDEAMEDILSLLSSPDAYEDMPDQLLLALSQAATRGLLPEDILQLVKRECKRRGL